MVLESLNKKCSCNYLDTETIQYRNLTRAKAIHINVASFGT